MPMLHACKVEYRARRYVAYLHLVAAWKWQKRPMEVYTARRGAANFHMGKQLASSGAALQYVTLV